MRTRVTSPLFCRAIGVAILGIFASGIASAAPVKIEAVVAPKADARMDFVDGTKRYVVAAQREGKATGTGPLANATVLEWGMHDVDPASGAHANGYLIFTAAEGDTAYLKYRFRGVPVPGPDGKARFLANGYWETVGGTGKFKGIKGTGSLRFNPGQRQFVLEGDIAGTD
jgi:hypothetical protein